MGMSLSNLRIRTRFMLLLVLFFAGFLLYGAWSFKTLAELKVNGPLYQRIVQSKDLIADVLPPPEYIIEYMGDFEDGTGCGRRGSTSCRGPRYRITARMPPVDGRPNVVLQTTYRP